MANETYDLGRATGILADAVGEPGKRRFRILARNDFELANLWVEREQLQAMAMAVEKLLAQVPGADVGEEDPDRPPREGAISFDLRPNVEFRVGQLALGYEEQHKLFLILAHDAESEPNTAPAFSCLVTRPQLQAFGFAVYALVAAGRPRCPICGLPEEGGRHDHAQSNGHQKGDEP
ncbi:MAG: DUF3090 family protein [Chloroflexota bacterium]|nr:DUF3090 family protein [Chloroflexota bacterium]